MKNDLKSFKVFEAMKSVDFTVSPTEKIESVAKLFDEQRVHSAPVVDEIGKCVGILTSSDLVRFQTEWTKLTTGINHGLSYEMTRQEPDDRLEIVRQPYDEVQRHMTACLQTIDKDFSLHDASMMMCQQHIHHLVVLDESERPVGILSSLDVLRKLVA